MIGTAEQPSKTGAGTALEPRGLPYQLKCLRRRWRSSWLRLLGKHSEAAWWYARTVPGMFRRDEMELLYRLAVQERGPGQIAEVGSWKGRSTVLLAFAIRDSREPARLFAIDPHVGSEEHREIIAREGSTLGAFRRNVAAAGVADWVEAMVMRSTDGASALRERGEQLKLAFIDGAHDEASVREDIRAFLPLMRPRGLFVFHDCDPQGGHHPGVWPAVDGELRERADVVAHASSLWALRLRN